VNHVSLFERNPKVAVLILLGILVFPILMIFTFRKLFAKMAGWKRLVERFPPTEIERPGETYRRQSGIIGRSAFEGSFALQVIQEGLIVRPNFATKSPILIPWSQISAVSAPEGRFLGVEQSILLTVEWETALQFFLPHQALPTVEQNVPADRFTREKVPSSIGELLRERLKNRKPG
jgi:hypothetical protein